MVKSSREAPREGQTAYIPVSVAYPTYLGSSWEHQPRHDNSIPHARPYVKLVEIKSNLRRKKNFIERIKDPILLKAYSSNRDNVGARFFFKSRAIHSYINSTRDIETVKCFSSIEMNKPFPAPVHNIS